MEDWLRELVELFIPSLSEYGEKPILLVGCRASGFFYDVCEMDLLILESERAGLEQAATRAGLVEIHRVCESALQICREKPHFVTCAIPLHDPNLTAGVLSHSLAGFRRRWVREQVAEAMALLGRARVCHRSGDRDSALLWLTASAYKLIALLLVNSGFTPSPSHLTSLIRSQRAALPRRVYPTLVEVLGLGFADRLSLERRLEVLKTLKGESPIRLRMIYRKVQFMKEKGLLSEAYGMLGYLILDSLGLFTPPQPRSKPPDAYRVRLHRRTRRRAFPDPEGFFEDLAGRLQAVIEETWRETRPLQS